MSYAPLPNPSSERDDLAQHEMNAAFEDSDDEEEESTETQPLASNHQRSRPPSQSRVPATYDFESVDYDYPPPGSPPPNSAFGNSNGLVPSFTDIARPPAPSGNWLARLRSLLPARYTPLSQRPRGPVGGGESNDGVFSNVTAKPAAPVTIQDGDETYVLPEETRAEAPPSYQSAQADAVPPYWETTVHAPFSPDSAGEIIIDNLPTGSLFSFLWNMLVSISFQFVGFLLTYLLHTTHSARLGSRAGLGVTLIQYGFTLRTRTDYQDNNWSDWRTGNSPKPTPAPTTYSTIHGSSQGNTTLDSYTEEQASIWVADATTEWLSFFLMTVGWFILLTSLLGYWRVKRWERGILASQRENTQPTQQRDRPASQFDRLFGLSNIARADMIRQGFGFGPRAESEADRTVTRAEEGLSTELNESDLTIRISPDDPNRQTLIREALMNEQRLQNDLRAAGLL